MVRVIRRCKGKLARTFMQLTGDHRRIKLGLRGIISITSDKVSVVFGSVP